MIKKILFLLLLSLSVNISASDSQSYIQLSDSSEISIITNAPWTGAIYGLFGHASIRVKDSENRLDVVFNYGMFDFNKPNFIYHFVRGETDYMVAPIPFFEFIEEYQEKGLKVDEQVLNLGLNERQRVWDALYTNALPENREYRYNFVFDNCATRPFNMVEKNISEKIILPKSSAKISTFRDLLNEFLEGHAWDKFGINLVIGAGADRAITERESIFLPKYLHSVVGQCTLDSAGEKRPLVLKDNVLNPQTDTVSRDTPFSPWFVGITLFLIACLISYRQWKAKKTSFLSKFFDTILFAAAGIGGIILTFLIFFSVHPFMSPNWNYVWLQPFALLAACLFFVKRCGRFIYYYHFINFALLSMFLLAWFLIPQRLELSFLPYVATIWLRSGISVKTATKGKGAVILNGKKAVEYS